MRVFRESLCIHTGMKAKKINLSAFQFQLPTFRVLLRTSKKMKMSEVGFLLTLQKRHSLDYCKFYLFMIWCTCAGFRFQRDLVESEFRLILRILSRLLIKAIWFWMSFRSFSCILGKVSHPKFLPDF